MINHGPANSEDPISGDRNRYSSLFRLLIEYFLILKCVSRENDSAYGKSISAFINLFMKMYILKWLGVFFFFTSSVYRVSAAGDKGANE